MSATSYLEGKWCVFKNNRWEYANGEPVSQKLSYRVSPSATIKECLLDKFAKEMDIELDKAAGLLSGEVGIDGEIAGKLEQVFGAPSSFWINLQRNYGGG